MKFIVNTSALLQKLQAISGTIAAKPILPILDHFLFDIKNGVLTITSTDLETSMSTSLDVQAEEDCLVAVPSRLTIDTLRSLPNQPITFTLDADTNAVELRSENGRYKLAGQPGVDFPKIPEIETESSFEMKSSVLLSSISKTIFATGNDDLRLNLTGVYVELFQDSANFVATDANRLVRLKRKDVSPGVEHSFILPKKALNLLKSSLTDDGSAVRVEYNQRNAFFNFGDIQLICRFIDERYPDYNAVIPAENPRVLTINRNDFLNSVRRISIFSNKSTHQIRLKISGSELVISTEDMDMANEATERLACDFKGDDIEIGFNSRLLMEVLSNMDSENINLEMSVPSRAGILLPDENDEGEDLLMLVMPMMLNASS
ncbi:MAG: DNA polymerase III subunit beta [Flavobacteriales bacterium]|nr:DNA polymerase III subunit beta [Flavobacteriales bacterium]